MSTNKLPNTLAQIELGKLALANGDWATAGEHFESAAEQAKPNQADEPSEDLELARFEALKLWSRLLTPWQQASFLDSVILESHQSQTAAGAKVICELLIERGDAWSQVGGWTDALANYESALQEGRRLGSPTAVSKATNRITLAKQNLEGLN